MLFKQKNNNSLIIKETTVMKPSVFSILFLFLIFIPVNSFALPLPYTAMREFSGYVVTSDGRTDLSGTMEFSLSFQEDVQDYTMDNVGWNFTGMDYSGNYSFHGQFNNEWAFAHPTLPNDLTEAPWYQSYWEGLIYSQIGASGTDLSAPIYFGDLYDQPNWVFSDNSNFLPEHILCPGRYMTLELYFSPSPDSPSPDPVPEPSVILLLSLGISGITIKRKFTRNATIN